MTMLLWLYLSPRVLRIDMGIPEWISPLGIIVSGCGEATNMAKHALYDIIERIQQNKSDYSIFQLYLDDTKQFDQDLCEDKLVRRLGPVTRELVLALQKQGYVVSPKTVVLASKPQIAKIILRILVAAGVKAKAA